MRSEVPAETINFSVTRQNLDNGAVAVNFSVGGGSNDQFDIQIINGTTTVSGILLCSIKFFIKLSQLLCACFACTK